MDVSNYHSMGLVRHTDGQVWPRKGVLTRAKGKVQNQIATATSVYHSLSVCVLYSETDHWNNAERRFLLVYGVYIF